MAGLGQAARPPKRRRGILREILDEFGEPDAAPSSEFSLPPRESSEVALIPVVPTCTLEALQNRIQPIFSLSPLHGFVATLQPLLVAPKLTGQWESFRDNIAHIGYDVVSSSKLLTEKIGVDYKGLKRMMQEAASGAVLAAQACRRRLERVVSAGTGRRCMLYVDAARYEPLLTCAAQTQRLR
jgi:hypothetical protein